MREGETGKKKGEKTEIENKKGNKTNENVSCLRRIKTRKRNLQNSTAH